MHFVLNHWLYITWQVALCNAYVRICRSCPPHVWKPEALLNMICSLSTCSILQDCLEVAIFILGPNRVGGGTISTTSSNSATPDKGAYRVRLECKRKASDIGTSKSKRHKIYGEEFTSDFDGKRPDEFGQLNIESIEKYASDMCNSFLSAVEFLKPSSVGTKPIRDELALATLSMLCVVFCKYPNTNLSVRIFELIYSWIPWICQQV